MNIDDTLTRAFTDLKIVGKIKKENLLNNLGVESNMKLYSHPRTKKLGNFRTPDDMLFKLIVCNGNITPREYFNLKNYNQVNK